MEPVMEPAEEPVMEMEALAPELDDQPLVTRTMAELFVSQGLVDRALEVFRQLLEVTPGDAGLRQRVAELSARLEEPPTSEPDARVTDEDDLSGHAWDAHAQADHHDVETPFAWTRQDAEETSAAGPPVSDYFGAMLGWEADASEQPDDDSEAEAEGEGAQDDDLANWLNREDT